MKIITEFKDLEDLKAQLGAGKLANKVTIAYAAQHKMMDCVEFLHKKRCPWDGWVLYWAYDNNDKEMIDYAWTEGCSLEMSKHSMSLKLHTLLDRLECPEHRLDWDGIDAEEQITRLLSQMSDNVEDCCKFLRFLVKNKFPFPENLVKIVLTRCSQQNVMKILDALDDFITVNHLVIGVDEMLDDTNKLNPNALILSYWVQQKMFGSVIRSPGEIDHH